MLETKGMAGGRGWAGTFYFESVAPDWPAPHMNVRRPSEGRYLTELGPSLPCWQMCGAGSRGAMGTSVAPPTQAPQKRVSFRIFFKKGLFLVKLCPKG